MAKTQRGPRRNETSEPDPATAATATAPVGAGPLYSIGALAEAAGLSAEQVRMWERRHGRPQALRLPSGHRRYTEETLRWLRRVAEALARGHRPQQVLALDDDALDELLGMKKDAGAPAAVRARPQSHPSAALLAALRKCDVVPLQRWMRSLALAETPLEAARSHLGPLLATIGEAWRDGTLGVAQEHLASACLAGELARWQQSFPLTVDRPRVLLATFSGERHGLGLALCGLVAAARGVPVHMLGIDTPLGEIQAAAGALRSDIVGIGVSLSSSGLETERRLAMLRTLLDPRVQIVAGGHGVATVRHGPKGVLRIADLAQWDRLVASWEA